MANNKENERAELHKVVVEEMGSEVEERLRAA